MAPPITRLTDKECIQAVSEHRSWLRTPHGPRGPADDGKRLYALDVVGSAGGQTEGEGLGEGEGARDRGLLADDGKRF